MKNRKEKVVAAITGAIAMYLQAEEEARSQVELPPEKLVPIQMAVSPMALPSPWVMAGRQAAMEMRRMLQMRLLR